MDEKKLPLPRGPNLPVSTPASGDDDAPPNSAAEFFRNLKPEIRRAKPSSESIEDALQAIQRAQSQSRAAATDTGTCGLCGKANEIESRFCGACGAPLTGAAPAVVDVNPGHQYHHHYHHHYIAGGAEGLLQGLAQGQGTAAASRRDLTRSAATPGSPALSRQEATIRKQLHDWVAACNMKQLDDLAELYAPDALVLRSNYPAVRGTAAIREFFFSALDAGLGEVELEPLRTVVAGDFAFETGRCKMLVPVVVGKRREERGKYVAIFARQSNGEWLITVDCWAADLAIKTPSEPATESGASGANRTPRRGT